MAAIVEQRVSRLTLALLAFSLAFPLPFAHAFCPQRHQEYIIQAFAAYPAVYDFAELQAALDASVEVDRPSMNPLSKRFIVTPPHMHSMRRDNTTLFEAKAQGARYVEDEMKAAVREAKRGRQGEAGRHLGRVLHTVQDSKHNWSSCAPASNRPESSLDCSESDSGCPHKGQGHHGLRLACLVPADVPTTEIVNNGVLPAIQELDLSRLCQGYSTKNFQILTDVFPLPEQRSEAEWQSRDAVAEFMKRVK